jgi:hypothetical protein
MLANFAVGISTVAVVSRMREHGSVSRRTCVRDCRGVCRDPGAPGCSDANMRSVFAQLGLNPQQSVVTGTCAEGVGFLETCALQGRGSFRETDRDYAAFFARVGDRVAIATHLADCGFAVVEFPGVFGFIHLTRLNMSVPAARHFLHHALGHYGARIEDVRIRLVSGITAANFPQRFADTDGSRPEDRFPGWFAKGLLRNRSRPLWLPSDGIDPSHVWEPDNREMMRRQLLDTGIGPDQLEMRDMIDPGDLASGHASHSMAMRGHASPGRDAYVIVPRALVGQAEWARAAKESGEEGGDAEAYAAAEVADEAITAARADSWASLWAMPSRPS